MIKMAVRGVVAWLLLGGAVLAQSTSDLFPGSDSSAKNSVKLTTVLMALPAGTPWLSMRSEPLALPVPRGPSFTEADTSVVKPVAESEKE